MFSVLPAQLMWALHHGAHAVLEFSGAPWGARDPESFYLSRYSLLAQPSSSATWRQAAGMVQDNQAAVAALLAAKDIEDLEAAIQQASFLDAIPGEDRQKLRGATGGPAGRRRVAFAFCRRSSGRQAQGS